MSVVEIRGVKLGQGRPKICIPVMGKTKTELYRSAVNAMEQTPDMVEWRADFLDSLLIKEEVLENLCMLREVLKETPLLFTIRTKAEGGEQEITPVDYERILMAVMKSRCADAIDVELFMGAETAKRLIDAAHKNKVTVIGSNHDFEKTPEEEEIIRRLLKMQETGMDIAKIAVMPRSRKDVLTLLCATERMREEGMKIPVITMSMGEKGVISRLTGEIFGSALTFGMAGMASAPGQIPAGELKNILDAIHRYSGEEGLHEEETE